MTTPTARTRRTTTSSAQRTPEIQRRPARSLRVAVMVAVGVALAVGVGAFLREGGADDQPESMWMFSHTSRTAVLEPSPDGDHRLILEGIDSDVTAFTDRPERRSEMLPPADLAAGWDALFSEDSPNAVLVGHLPNGEANSLVVELSEPVVEGERMTYSVEILSDEGSSADTSREFASVSLFIDSADVVPPTGTANIPVILMNFNGSTTTSQPRR